MIIVEITIKRPPKTEIIGIIGYQGTLNGRRSSGSRFLKITTAIDSIVLKVHMTKTSISVKTVKLPSIIIMMAIASTIKAPVTGTPVWIDVYKRQVNVVHHGKALQVIVGLDVPQVLDEMTQLMQQSGNEAKVSTEPDNPYIERATGIVDLLGGGENIKDVIACSTRVRAHVFDPKKVAPDSEFKKIADSYEVQHKDNNEIDIVVGLDADQVVDQIKQLL